MDVLRRLSARRAGARPGRHQVERPLCGRLPGRPAAGARRQPRRRHAVLHRLQGAQHRAARSRDPARLKLNEYGLFRVDGRRARRRRDARKAIYDALGPGLGRAGAAREPRRDRGRRRAARCPAWSSAADLRGDLHMHTTATDGRDDARGRWRRRRTGSGTATSPSPITARRSRWRTGSTRRARSRTPRASAR